MRALALVVLCVAACGKVHSLSDAGADAPAQVDASAGCQLQSCSLTADQCCPGACNADNDVDCAAVCGNGAVEPGETCDPLASCPTDCPTIGCQLRTLQGGGTCAAQCVNGATISLCSEGSDNCCPPGCTAANDIDCAAVCDNGVIEPGEQCDPLASCPTDCPQQACNLYTLFSAGTCQAQCVVTSQQTSCVDNDGCCPGGCDANNDNDCQPSCGNGVIEAGETCDPPGSCPVCSNPYTCYTTTGSAATCDLVCDVPVTTCGINGDSCCAFDKSGGCDSTDDAECAGTKWQRVSLAMLDYSKGCTTHRVAGFVKGGSYLFTSCDSSATGTGDPYLKSVIDDKLNSYPVGNDNCTAAGALPNLINFTCKSPSGPSVMFCGPPNPGGFILPVTPVYLDVTVCPNVPGTSTFTVWFNAPVAPHEG
jgi:hypothetical protein